jgi:hypothetical protein
VEYDCPMNVFNVRVVGGVCCVLVEALVCAYCAANIVVWVQWEACVLHRRSLWSSFDGLCKSPHV